ncbi:hypothetical protein F511_47008 [Dorcoceras hygrometricum]|uniref:Uncharacterized protein n=1 Tax=Dorcoceras hygrometricum TaxID=472368 RepID=A0A2Z6ZS54_9LAMI|nr:hypothetical protein F511_47008 [Dorcoceras hygrometricum]
MRAGRAWWPAMASSRVHFFARWPRLAADVGRGFVQTVAQSAAAMEGARWPVMLRKLLRTLADRMLPLVCCWLTPGRMLAGRWRLLDAQRAHGRASRLARRRALPPRVFRGGGAAGGHRPGDIVTVEFF